MINKLTQLLEEASSAQNKVLRRSTQISLCNALLDIYEKTPFFDADFSESSPQFLSCFKQWYSIHFGLC